MKVILKIIGNYWKLFGGIENVRWHFMLSLFFLQNTAGDASFPARYSPLSDFVQSPSGNYPFVFDNLFVKKKRKESPRNESVPNLSESYNEVCK